MPLFPSHPACVHPYFGFRSDTTLRLTARALRARRPSFEPGGRWRAVRTLLTQYASHEVAGLPVTLELEAPDGTRHSFDTTTDKEGYARFDLTLPQEWPLPADPAWEIGTLHWRNDEGAQTADAPILVPGTATRLAVISDIDDTIIETGITGGLRSLARNWRRIFAHLPDERSAVPGADAFYGALGGGSVTPDTDDGGDHTGDRLPATHRPFFYVSSSPWNLFGYLVAFKQAKGLPLGPMMLRDWGLNRATLGSGSHGAHKVEAIRRILSTYPDLRFALIGDDTQGDLPAFAGIAEQARHAIAAIFIRKAATDDLSAEEIEAKTVIESLGIPLWVGPSYDIGRDFLRAVGFTPGGETERLVEAVEEEAEEAEA